MKKLVIFDMDGTILDTLQDLCDAMNYCLDKYGMPLRKIDEIRRFVGNGLGKLVERACVEGTSRELLDEILECLKKYYLVHCYDKTKPYEGIIDLIKEIREKGYKTAVVSNKAHDAVLELNDKFFEGLFDEAYGECEGIERKPAPDLVNMVLDSLKIDAKDAVYIGDSEVDLLTAKNSNMDCIAVTWGFRDKDLLIENGATNIADTTLDVMKILLNFNL